jgi:hypothetical protein
MVCPHFFAIRKKNIRSFIGNISFGLSLRHQTAPLSLETYRLLADTISDRFPLTPVYCRSDSPPNPNSMPLERSVTFYEYVIVDGKRYHASSTIGSNRSSLVHVRIPATTPVNAYGEILEIFQVNQDFRHTGQPLWMARARWFIPWRHELGSIWDEL